MLVSFFTNSFYKGTHSYLLSKALRPLSWSTNCCMSRASVHGWSAVEAKIASILNAASSFDMAILTLKDKNKLKVIKTVDKCFLTRTAGQIRDLEAFQGSVGGRWTWQRTNIRANLCFNMSRQQFAEAVLSNILHYFNSTKNSRFGNDIASRNFC